MPKQQATASDAPAIVEVGEFACGKLWLQFFAATRSRGCHSESAWISTTSQLDPLCRAPALFDRRPFAAQANFSPDVLKPSSRLPSADQAGKGFAYIQSFEYTIISMRDDLRRFKSEIFQALAHPTRIAIVEMLRDGGELTAGKLIERLGLEQANASQHLAILRSKHVLVNRKVANQVFYSIRDHALIEVLDILRRYFYSQLQSTVSMLEEVAQSGPERK